MHRFLVVGLVALSLAGCLGDNSDDGQITFTSEPEDVQFNATNAAPEVTLGLDLINGTAPLLVNFTFDATDPDGDNLTWQFDPTGNGTIEASGEQLPASFNWTYMAGNFTPLLFVSDGNVTATASGIVTVEAGEIVVAPPAGPCGEEPEPCIVDEDTFVEFWSDGSCHMKDDYVQSGAGGIYINDRYTIAPGTGLVSGGGTWIYEESNGQPGMWVHADEGGSYAGCVNGDTLIF